MCFFFSFVPATIFIVLGYFVLFSASRAEGTIQKFGQLVIVVVAHRWPKER